MEKTAMMQLKEKLQAVVKDLEGAVHGTDPYGYRGAMENVIKDIDAQMLKIERRQIVAAYNHGWNFPNNTHNTTDGHDYYKTFYKE